MTSEKSGVFEVSHPGRHRQSVRAENTFGAGYLHLVAAAEIDGLANLARDKSGTAHSGAMVLVARAVVEIAFELPLSYQSSGAGISRRDRLPLRGAEPDCVE